MEATLSATPHWSEIINNLAVAFGAIIGGLGGAKVLFSLGQEYKENRRRKRLEQELKSKYSPKALGKTFLLIKSSENPDWIYLLDLKTDKKKHHIASNATFVALGYDRGMVKALGREVFNQYKEGSEFLTQGERLS